MAYSYEGVSTHPDKRIQRTEKKEQFDRDARELVMAYMKFKSEHPDALLTFTGESVEGPYRVFIDRPKNYTLTITDREG